MKVVLHGMGHLELGGIFMKGIRKLLKSVLVMAIAFSLFSSSLANDLVGNPTKAEAYYDNLYILDLRPGVSYSAKSSEIKLSSFNSEHEGEHKHFSNWSKKKSVILQKIKGGGKNI